MKPFERWRLFILSMILVGLIVASAFACPTMRALNSTPAAGPCGTWVIIRGYGFTPDCKVSFGGVPAPSVVYISPTELHVQAPC